MSNYQFNLAMKEISGFGGEYEECCRRMLVGALEWLDSHPEADPKFTGFNGIYGVISEDNSDAKALSKAACDAAGEYGPTGAMHQAVISTAMWINANGWGTYVARMTHPDGEVGILKDKLASTKEDLERSRKLVEKLLTERGKRGSIIAEKVLGWKRYKVSNGEQEAYAPSQLAATEGIGIGCQLSKLVDEAIQAMQIESVAA